MQIVGAQGYILDGRNNTTLALMLVLNQCCNIGKRKWNPAVPRTRPQQ